MSTKGTPAPHKRVYTCKEEGKRITIYLTAENAEYLRTLAVANSVSVSYAVNRLLMAHKGR